MSTRQREVYKDGQLVATENYEVPAEVDNRDALDTRMDSALDGLRSYVALATPTAAQTAVAVKLLCRVAIAIIRLQRGRLDGID